MKSSSVTPANARIRLEELCSRSEHSEGEVREKLRQWRVSPADADKIVRHLMENRFIDDLRYARAYSRHKMLINHWGRKKIMVALIAKKVSRSFIEEALGELDETEYLDTLHKAMQSKARLIKEGNCYEGRTKLYRAMLSRGFESNLISNLLRNQDSGIWD